MEKLEIVLEVGCGLNNNLMQALEFLIKLRDEYNCIPPDPSRIGNTSNSCIRRWLNNKGIEINGEYPKHDDNIEFPIKSLVFFPKGKKVTIF